jgi:hypothetical protein
MHYTIQLMNHKLEYSEKITLKDKKKKITKNFSETGYAFVDQYGHCHIIVYGEFLKNYYKKVFLCQ